MTGISAFFTESTALLLIATLGFCFCERPLAATETERLLHRAAEAGRPVLVIGSSDYCGPCRALHRTLAEDALVRQLLESCLHRELDVQSSEFVTFAEQFSLDVQAIPMVCIILPDGSTMYAKSGGLAAPQLSQLLQLAIQRAAEHGPSASSLAGTPQLLTAARDRAREGELIDCLQLLQQWQRTRSEPVSPALLAESQSLEQETLAATLSWIRQLDELMRRPESMHGAAYRVAELYVELPAYAEVRRAAGGVLRRHELQPGTRTAVRQAKSLLVARYHEHQRTFPRALQSYWEVVRLDHSTPAGRFAQRRIELLTQHVGHNPAAGSRPRS